MNLAVLVWLLEPAAMLGAGVAILAGAGVLYCYRGSQAASLKRHLRNWRLMQVLGIVALYFLALAASGLIARDYWGWLYVMVGLRTGLWWYQWRFNSNLSLERPLRRPHPRA